MTITEMRDKRKKLVDTMDLFLETHRKDGVLSAADDTTYTSMETEFAQLTDEIHRMERREDIENELKKPVNAPITEKPMKSNLTDDGEPRGRKSKVYKKTSGTPCE